MTAAETGVTRTEEVKVSLNIAESDAVKAKPGVRDACNKTQQAREPRARNSPSEAASVKELHLMSRNHAVPRCGMRAWDFGVTYSTHMKPSCPPCSYIKGRIHTHI